MKNWKCLVAIAVSFQALGASDMPKQEALSRLEQAVAKTNLFELPSFEINAGVQVDHRGKIVDGTYHLLWNGPGQWKEEVRIADYTKTQIGGKGVIWVERSLDAMPFSILRLHQVLGFGSSAGVPPSVSLVRLPLTATDTLKKAHERKDHGDKLLCFEIEHQQRYTSNICVSDSSGTLTRAMDSDFRSVGGKVFPRVLGDIRADKARVNITEIVTPAQIPPGTFQPPIGVSPRAGCMNPVPATLVKSQAPIYPPDLRVQHIQGTTATDTLIGTDGVPQIKKIVESPNSELSASSVQAISQWRYQPAMCGGVAIEMETVLQVNYTLSY
jgi:Gram-negative bacterial TonB protein C-terminal